MLNFLSTGAVLATVLNTQIHNSPLILPENAIYQQLNNNTSSLMVQEIPEKTHTRVTNDQTPTPRVFRQLEPTEILLVFLILSGVAVAVVLISKKASHVPSVSHSTFKSRSNTEAITIEQASPRLRQQLLRLLHNDRAAANRLVSQVKKRNPHKSINWSIEKVIYDLERDRGGR